MTLLQYFVAISDNEGYGILITGYSLGAGVCHLLAMDLMKKQREDGEIPQEVSIRCLSYGAPPVYECPEGTTYPNIFSVFNNHDGLGIYDHFHIFNLYNILLN